MYVGAATPTGTAAFAATALLNVTTGGHYVSAGVGVADIYEFGIRWESTAGGESRTQFLILWETLRGFMKKIIYASMP
jgi:hypothetical protein